MKRVIALLVVIGLFAAMSGVAAAQQGETDTCTVDNSQQSQFDLPEDAADQVDEHNPVVNCDVSDGPIDGR